MLGYVGTKPDDQPYHYLEYSPFLNYLNKLLPGQKGLMTVCLKQNDQEEVVDINWFAVAVVFSNHLLNKNYLNSFTNRDHGYRNSFTINLSTSLSITCALHFTSLSTDVFISIGDLTCFIPRVSIAMKKTFTGIQKLIAIDDKQVTNIKSELIAMLCSSLNMYPEMLLQGDHLGNSALELTYIHFPSQTPNMLSELISVLNRNLFLLPLAQENASQFNSLLEKLLKLVMFNSADQQLCLLNTICALFGNQPLVRDLARTDLFNLLRWVHLALALAESHQFNNEFFILNLALVNFLHHEKQLTSSFIKNYPVAFSRLLLQMINPNYQEKPQTNLVKFLLNVIANPQQRKALVELSPTDFSVLLTHLLINYKFLDHNEIITLLTTIKELLSDQDQASRLGKANSHFFIKSLLHTLLLAERTRNPVIITTLLNSTAMLLVNQPIVILPLSNQQQLLFIQFINYALQLAQLHDPENSPRFESILLLLQTRSSQGFSNFFTQSNLDQSQQNNGALPSPQQGPG